jgi:hypothetical protein
MARAVSDSVSIINRSCSYSNIGKSMGMRFVLLMYLVYTLFGYCQTQQITINIFFAVLNKFIGINIGLF